ncbi:LLM class flavin-dependent oxidoreductase [Rhodococcus zopfii]|uniref:LLM class flavin-dependent oxidoreductase n=1 Tax=Rhodococcus zopfii TaxID=43772 RepID=A0ABU3WRH6_9NOCA|nr:LLM class flavin-dependent oxidoreductase [Rhodococcus zopfii]
MSTAARPPQPQRRLTLAASIVGAGASARAWNWPGTKWNRFADWEHYRRSAEIARSGILDAVFVSDHPALQRDSSRSPGHLFDPITLFSAIAGAVPDIGFVLTASTSYNSPYNLARRLASLDTISGGRVIFNAVASFNPDIAANFTADGLLDREDRYRKADEFLEVVKKLWLSWDAPDGPEPTGPLWDETTARVIDHHGEFFDVRGPLNVPVGPQGYPVISQAGASEQGIDFAGKHAEIVYAALLSKQAALDYTATLDAAARAHGRPADSIRLFPGVNVYVGDTPRGGAASTRSHQRRLQRRGTDRQVPGRATRAEPGPAAVDRRRQAVEGRVVRSPGRSDAAGGFQQGIAGSGTARGAHHPADRAPGRRGRWPPPGHRHAEGGCRRPHRLVGGRRRVRIQRPLPGPARGPGAVRAAGGADSAGRGRVPDRVRLTDHPWPLRPARSAYCSFR